MRGIDYLRTTKLKENINQLKSIIMEKAPIFDVVITHREYGELDTQSFYDLKEGVKWLANELENWADEDIESIKIVKDLV